MRTPEDIVQINFTLLCGLSLDQERVEQDPVWAQVTRHVELDDPGERERALQRYVGYYLEREHVLAEMPGTNGPAILAHCQFEPTTRPLSAEMRAALIRVKESFVCLPMMMARMLPLRS
jgi:hypothetical protein